MTKKKGIWLRLSPKVGQYSMLNRTSRSLGWFRCKQNKNDQADKEHRKQKRLPQ